MSNLLKELDYICNALENVEFKLIRKRDDIEDESIAFAPTMAHQIFGEQESIFGYKDLKIKLYYIAGSLDIYYGLQYSERIDFNRDLCLKPDDINEKIKEILPMGKYTTSLDTFLSDVDKNETFSPPGEKIDYVEILCKDTGIKRSFEFYKCDITTPNFLSYHSKFQTFILWFVDAGSYVDYDDPQWMFIICVEKYKNSEGKTLFASVGYSTLYIHYAYPEHIRPRISQLLVLPPFQRMGIGGTFIKVIHNYFIPNPKVITVTAEDPSEDFMRIRNFIIVKMCKSLPEFQEDKLKNGFSKEMKNAAQEKFKVSSQQCRIVYEILRLYYTNVNNEEEYKAYRIAVKGRINTIQHNHQTNVKKAIKKGFLDAKKLLKPNIQERIEELKLEYQDVEDEYHRILRRLQEDKIN